MQTKNSFYKKYISPFLGLFFGGSCRFYPSCSQYASEAVRIHGIFQGSRLALNRVIKCNPFSSCGLDPVPDKV